MWVGMKSVILDMGCEGTRTGTVRAMGEELVFEKGKRVGKVGKGFAVVRVVRAASSTKRRRRGVMVVEIVWCGCGTCETVPRLVRETYVLVRPNTKDSSRYIRVPN